MKRIILAALLALFAPSMAHAAYQFEDITCETTTTTGTGTLTLGGAVTNYLPFATTITSGNTVPYNIVASDGKVETGSGVFTSPSTLTRAVVDWSTNGAGTALTLPAGTHRVCLGFTSGTFLDGVSSLTLAKLSLATGGPVEFDGGTSNTFACTGGNCSIEGNGIYRAGGTDVAVADGGTGASTLNDLITLSTMTTGVYVAQVADGTGIDGTANAEGATYTPTLDLTEITTATWGVDNFTTMTFSTDGIDLTWDYSTVDGAAILSGGGSSPILGIDDGGQLRFYEEDAGGSNTISFIAPTTIASDRTCQLVDGAAPIPDSCVGDGTDAGGSGTTGTHTFWMPAGAMIPRVTTGPTAATLDSGSNDLTLPVLDFNTTTQQFAQFTLRMPKNWDEGTFTFAPMWTAASGSGGVVWAVQCVAISDDDTLNATFGTEQTSTDTLITALDNHVGATSSAITCGGSPAVGDLLVFQVKRNPADGSDTLAVDARLIGVTLFYTTDAENDN